ncbi:MAG: hypothetical protein R2794_02010 [Chitinophagales bacterium]
MNNKRIAFLYPPIFPVTGGSSLHGYYLAKGLTEAGYTLYTLQDTQDGFTQNRKRSPFNILRALWKCDLVYMRVNLSNRAAYILPFIRLFGKKYIIELNGPADELAAEGHAAPGAVEKMDGILGSIVSGAHSVITVSAVMENYVRTYLHYQHVRVIENGGEQFVASELHPDPALQQSINALKEKYERLVVWSGTGYPWQGIQKIEMLAEKLPAGACLLVVSNDMVVHDALKDIPHVVLFRRMQRKDLNWLITQCTVGLCIYGDFSWSRLGEFHGSSLKFYEYFANGLQIIATPTGHMKNIQSDAVCLTDDVDTMNACIAGAHKHSVPSYRSWDDVVQETITVIENL